MLTDLVGDADVRSRDKALEASDVVCIDSIFVGDFHLSMLHCVCKIMEAFRCFMENLCTRRRICTIQLSLSNCIHI
jgi:hypothetical protein